MALLLFVPAIILFGLAWLSAGECAAELDLRACEERHHTKCFWPGFHRTIVVLGPLAFLLIDYPQNPTGGQPS